MFIKESRSYQNAEGWGKMFYCFTDLDRYDSPFFLNYLIDTEPVVRHRCQDEGFEDYLQYSESFIQEKFFASRYVINSILDDLINHNYIFVHNGGNKKNGLRYIKLNPEKIYKVLGVEEGVK